MALGDIVLCRQRSMNSMGGGHLSPPGLSHLASNLPLELIDDLSRRNQVEDAHHLAAAEEDSSCTNESGATFLPNTSYLCDLRHDAHEATVAVSEPGVVSRWRMKDRMKTGWVALCMCLNIGVDPPDVIKISPCARLECWIDPFSTASVKALEAIAKNLQTQYERWQPRARYKVSLDPTVEDVKKLCLSCRKNAKGERVLFHYNGHGVPKPTVNGEIWVFNKNFTQYIPLSVYDLELWLGNPSIYVFDCSAAGMIVNAFCERSEWGSGGASSGSLTSAMKECILLAACGANETLPQNSELPADVFTSCLTTPIKIALRWFCPRSLLQLDSDLIDRIPGRQNDRKTPLGELNWIFTAITDTIAWNVLPRELFQRLFRQDLLVASLFRNFLLAERIMRAANCCPVSYPRLPPTHQHPMWHAWDMAAEICLSQLPALVDDPNAEFQPSPFFTEQLTAFEVWLDHGSERKKPPEQLPIVLQVLLSQSHRFRALVLLGRFLDMGAWAVDLALSVGIFPYVLKLLQTTATDLRQILVFIWTKILALDKSCQVDLVKDGGHSYFIHFLENPDIHAEQRAMAAYVLAVIVDGHQQGQHACIQAGLIGICLSHIQAAPNALDGQTEPQLLQWLCLCLGKLWDGVVEGVSIALHDDAPAILGKVLSEPQPEVRAAAVFALGTLLKVRADGTSSEGADNDMDEDTSAAEQRIANLLLTVLWDGSPLVRAELAVALARLAFSHNRMFRQAAAAYLKPPSHSAVVPYGTGYRNPGYPYSSQFTYAGLQSDSDQGLQTLDGGTPYRSVMRIVRSSGSLSGSPGSSGNSPLSDNPVLGESGGNASSNGGSRQWKRSEECNMYVQCIMAAYALARDSFPRVASLGRKVLRIGGADSAQVMVSSRAGGGVVGYPRNPSVSALPPTPAMAGVLHRSTSWVASSSGTLASTWRITTPPPSPPTRPAFLAAGMTTSGLSAVSPDAASIATLLPESTIYKWSCGHFSRPLLEPSHDDEEEIIARREMREKLALKGIERCQHSSVSKVSDQIGSLDTQSDVGTKAVLLHPFKPLVCSADENETIRIWDYDANEVINTFENHINPDKGISKLCLLNELDDSLLLVGSSDGSVRVWKDYTQKDKHRLATSWQAVQGHRPGARGVSAVVDWQQMTGYLYASGQISFIMAWDLDREQLVSRIPSPSDSYVSALAACQTHHAHVITGSGDGSVKIYDLRSREMLVCAMKPHTTKVVGLDFQPGSDFTKIISASQVGDLKFLDLRKSAPYLEVDAHKGNLTSVAVHRYADVIATGSGKQLIKTFSSSGELLSSVRYHNSFLGQRIGPVSSLHFHSYNVLLAAGASDSMISIYSGESIQGR
ncbi:regulatory-associated protein of TOR 1 isoform X3 [Physcomitrium patens]|uniref:Raptor N-terminal CASPase-like domain-containing protein n=1 Tax=Physcomitrium patens TaxID=3218 RepID=A0A7I4EQ17_PHYPA|nr:regulatory-associated protein of TOR 1-like isoform X3 [Physcomitrium patens]|eukprot:XP_024383773.1 regulatory-associated protein of TOR 1-like isoform X3 [Physcomitrella patens]